MIQKLLKLIILIICFFFTIPAPSAQAASNFSTSYNITYTVSEDGMTHAKLQGVLTNTNSLYYASSYKIMLGFDDIKNVKASDFDGTINPQVKKSDDGYEIGINFNTKAVGNGAKLPFTITFDTPVIAQKFGSVWEINIPGIANPEEFSNFTVNVVVPKTFGNPAYIKPAQPDHKLVFTKDQLGKSGISIAFGEKQLYAFTLKYHLRNDNVYGIKTEIALPPSTNYQEVYITQISPPPLNVVEDKDGNWLAEYRLKPTEKKDIEVTGVASVKLMPKEQSLTQKQLAEYLKEQPHWEISRDEIKRLAKELKTPKAIYDYVVKTLNYDFSRVSEDKPRLGALNSLKNSYSAVCLEFTDLFIALSRAAGIPAREVDGFAYTENSKQRPLSLVSDILHAWPEYYDKYKKTWIMVDPTWGNTTGGVDYFDVLDFDHFAFVIKGLDSNYPIPAGGYKFLDNKNTKDINIHFAEIEPRQIDIQTISDFPEVSIAGLPISGKITVRNIGTTKISPQTFFVNSNILSPDQQIVTTEGIPPFGQQTWNLKFRSTNFLTNINAPFTLHFDPDGDLGGKDNTHKIKISPFYFTLWGIGGIVFGIFIIFILIFALKIRRLHLSR